MIQKKEQFKYLITTTKKYFASFVFLAFLVLQCLFSLPLGYSRELGGVRSLIECLRRSLVEQNENKVYAYIRHT